MNFSDLKFEPLSTVNPVADGIHAKHFFPNGYGVSVIQSSLSYGNEEGLYELAVLQGTAENWEMCYDTPVTDDVIGYLKPENVTFLLNQIEAL